MSSKQFQIHKDDNNDSIKCNKRLLRAIEVKHISKSLSIPIKPTFFAIFRQFMPNQYSWSSPSSDPSTRRGSGRSRGASRALWSAAFWSCGSYFIATSNANLPGRSIVIKVSCVKWMNRCVFVCLFFVLFFFCWKWVSQNICISQIFVDLDIYFEILSANLRRQECRRPTDGSSRSQSEVEMRQNWKLLIKLLTAL